MTFPATEPAAYQVALPAVGRRWHRLATRFLAMLALYFAGACLATAGTGSMPIAQSPRQATPANTRLQALGNALSQRNATVGPGGSVVVFSGPSSPAKYQAAQVLGRQLGRNVERVDLSTVVGRYAGETEKNLARVFAAASASGAVLYFDEADALFGRRTTLKDSNGRYGNLQTNYLLQRIEAFAGVVILATNDQETTRSIRHGHELEIPPGDPQK